MRYSDNYNLKLPQRGVDRANVDDLDYNLEVIDGALADDRQISLLMYDSTQSYNTGDIRGYENPTTHRIRAFRCLEDNVTGPWDATKWAQTTLAAEIENGGGGTDVEANPSGTATADLEKLRVGQTIYDIPSATDMTGATSQAAGTHGLVPAPSAGDEGKVLYGDGTWKTPQSAPSNLDDLGDVTLTTPSDGQVLTYDDGDWVNKDLPAVTKTATGNPIEISDGANAPLVKCVSAITGYQEGSGTPSPDNIRPIVAYTEGKVEVRGKNLFDANISNVISGGRYVVITDNTITNTYTTAWSAVRFKQYFPAGTYVASAKSITPLNQLGTVQISRIVNGAYVQITSLTEDNLDRSFSLENGEDLVISLYSSQGNVTVTEFQIETGTTPTTYEPYTSNTHTTTYPSAIYRGSEDYVEGEVTEEWGMIDSYAGETLPGEWISDRDEYAPGTTPTAGAQVAYALATPTTSSVTPTNLPVKSLNGYTHIESSTGDMEIEYIVGKYQPIVDLIQSSQHVYSTQEQIIGTWIDSKTLYEKTLTYNQSYTYSNSGWGEIPFTGVPSDIETAISLDIIGGDDDGMQFNDNRVRYMVDLSGSSPKIMAYTTQAQQSVTWIIITMRYTKTASTRSLSKGATAKIEEKSEELTKEVDELLDEQKEELTKEPLEPISEPLETKTDNLSKDEEKAEIEDESKEIEEVMDVPEEEPELTEEEPTEELVDPEPSKEEEADER